MKNLSTTIIGCVLLLNTLHTSDHSPHDMCWSPIPAPHLEPSPTELTAESIAAADLPTCLDDVLTNPTAAETSTYTDYELYDGRSHIILRVPTGAHRVLHACTLIIQNNIQSIVPFNEAGSLRWNTAHRGAIEAARKRL